MVGHLRTQSGWRHAFAVAGLLALALRLLTPAGFMPGTSLAQPIVLCPDQGAMPGMAMPGHHHHADKGSHQTGDHPCAFAGLAATPFGHPGDLPDLVPPLAALLVPIAMAGTVAPGRGMAAPPPPSRAPPSRSA